MCVFYVSLELKHQYNLVFLKTSHIHVYTCIYVEILTYISIMKLYRIFLAMRKLLQIALIKCSYMLYLHEKVP